MFYDFNIPWPAGSLGATSSTSGGSSSASQPSKKKSKHQHASQSQSQPQQASTGPEAAPTNPEPLSLLRDKDSSTLHEIVSELGELGYSYMAFNRIVQSRFDPAQHSNVLATGRDGLPRPLFPQLDPRTNADSKKKNAPRSSHTNVTQLSRLTVVLDEQSMAKSGNGIVTNNATALQSYDLLAVRPTTEAAFQHACLTLSDLKPFSIDIISLDFCSQSRLPFLLKRTTVNAAIENGVQFEICYGPAVGCKSDGLNGDPSSSSSNDPLRARRNLISGVRDLLRITNGKGVFFSSGALEALALRGPHDVINLAAVFGLNPAAARDAISHNCRALLVRAQTRKTYRGVVSHPVVVGVEESQRIPPPRDVVGESVAAVPQPAAPVQTSQSASLQEIKASKGKRKRQA
ncbi:PHP domain-like protein [Testicularia cyperi]|uniref:PHP domain-like protein n=1 Tax=Testicularia cyperi TaxID=1882483 RepID=A0A317XZD4_9BASI|nr:PHP domain-like protein [Testicularia cyperi]